MASAGTTGVAEKSGVLMSGVATKDAKKSIVGRATVELETDMMSETELVETESERETTDMQ